MKLEKDASSTNARKPNPARANQERISRDLLRYKVLTNRVKRVIATDSPEWFEWVKDKVKDATDALKETDKSLADKAKENFSYSNDQLYNADTRLGSPLEKGLTNTRGQVISAVDGVYDWLEKGITNNKGEIIEADDPLDEWLEKGSTTPAGRIVNTTSTITTSVTKITEKIRDIINNIDIKMPSVEIEGLEALGALPGLILGIKFDVANWFKFDIKEYQDTVKLLETMTKPPEME